MVSSFCQFEVYYGFIWMINLDKIILWKGDIEHLAELKKVINDS
jgi:hypothetical protein